MTMWFTESTDKAIKKVLDRSTWEANDDIWEPLIQMYVWLHK